MERFHAWLSLFCTLPCRQYPEARDTGVRMRLQVCGSETEVAFWHARLDGVDYAFLDHPAFRHWAGEQASDGVALLHVCSVTLRSPCVLRFAVQCVALS